MRVMRRRRKVTPPATSMHWLVVASVLSLLVFGNYSHAHAVGSLFADPAKQTELAEEEASNAAISVKPVEVMRHKASPALRAVIDPPEDAIAVEYDCGECNPPMQAAHQSALPHIVSGSHFPPHSRAPPRA